MEVAHIKVVVIGFLWGTVLGSFVKALADRSLTKRTFLGRSYCPNCKKVLRWYDLLPILSHLLLKGRCRYCHRKIGVEYVVVEVVMGILVGYLFFQTFNNFQSFDSLNSLRTSFQFLNLLFELVYKVFFIIVLAILFLTDLKKMIIPDRIVIPSIIIAFLALLVITGYKIGYLYYYLSAHPVGQYLLPPHSLYFQEHALVHLQSSALAVVSGLVLASFFLLLIIITKGKGMGGGDVKLALFMGLGLGFPNIIVATMLSFIIGAVFSVGLIIFGKKGFRSVIPFGPFLVIGSLLALFWGEEIIDWYFQLSLLF
ncbi:MAG: A24 family peptidase [Candidatus Daviesbacteria bacterium]|nr:A24 family peptidase [Candidatus Daviesbacteria bacterium]